MPCFFFRSRAFFTHDDRIATTFVSIYQKQLLVYMAMVSSLIDSFRKQTRDTILEYMDRLAVNDAVYSTHLKGYEPYLKENNIIIYLHDNSMVVVCFDLCGRIEEIADEGDAYDIGAPEYFSQRGGRKSPVWQLSEAMKDMVNRTTNYFPPVEIWGVLLSESKILNVRDMKYQWDAMNIHVIDNLTGLRHREIATNNAYNEKARAILRDILDENAFIRTFKFGSPDHSVFQSKISDGSGNAGKDNDEFENLLNMFISDGYEKVEEGELPFEDSDISDNVEEDSDENNLKDIPKDNVHKIEDISIPDGYIEQNQNVSVTVEILRPISNPQKELDKLVGCTEIKKRMAELIALTKYNKLTKELFPNSKQHEVSLHSVFYGKPGTGKTTVCKIYGSLLRQAGALSKGHVVICDRGTFIGTHWGDEERSMRQVLEKAQGGVLMIDEAYTLNGKHESDPGKIVIQLLLNILADESKRDIAIVLCGYKEPMEALLNSNPGLQSRFPNKFVFPDFTIDELLDITLRRVREYEYEFTPQAWIQYKKIVTKAYNQRDAETWGNARFVANELERIYIQHATRCVQMHPVDKRQMRLLTPEDILPGGRFFSF